MPILLSYIQAIVDEKKVKEMFILTGSQQFNLLDSINQSLAGRTAIISLLPYSLKEINNYYKEAVSYDELIFTGSYPKLYEVGQILNYQNLGDDLVVSHNTIREWISILEVIGIHPNKLSQKSTRPFYDEIFRTAKEFDLKTRNFKELKS